MSLRFKRHYRLLVLLVLASTLLVAGMGDRPIVAYSLPGSEQMAVDVDGNETGVAALQVPAAAGSQVPVLDASYGDTGTGDE
jgi:hypothetical protein